MSMRRALIACIVALAVALPGLAAGPASASKAFTFYGSGYGHGVGMSQWGAFGLARRGWNYKKILTHYYSHTRVRKAKHAPRSIRVGLSQGDHEYRIEAQGGPVKVVVGSPKHGTVIGSVPGGKRWRVKAAGNNFKVLNSRGKRVGGKSWGGPKTNLYLVYGHGGSKVHVPEGGNTYNRGTLELNLYSCGGSCAMRLILDVSLEQYLYGVAEVSNSWPKDALRAQAVAARSYAIAKIAIYGQHAGSCNCGITAGLDQAYAGWDKEGSAGGRHWVGAVHATTRQVVAYKGKAIQAFYSASSGGFTENNENVWGGSPLPYLRGVCDPGDYVKQNPSRTWRAHFSRKQLTRDLHPYTGGIGTVRSFGSYKRGVSGRIVSVRVHGTHGSHNVSGAELRAGLGLRDDRVWINSDREVVGSIRTLYDRLNCAPGLPVSKDVKIAGGKGSKQDFKTGTIYRNEHAKVTVWLRGMLLATYQDHGGPKGKLGMPTSGVRKHGKKYSVNFQHGTIVCTKSGCKVA
jgi:SpoIID/LytB domain protein